MRMALVVSQRAAPLDLPRTAWKMKVAELFAITHVMVPTDVDLVPPKKTLPEASEQR